MKNSTKAFVFIAAAIVPAVLVYATRSKPEQAPIARMAKSSYAFQNTGFVRMVDESKETSESNPIRTELPKMTVKGSAPVKAPSKARATKTVSSPASGRAMGHRDDQCALHELEQGGSPDHPFVLVCTY